MARLIDADYVAHTFSKDEFDTFDDYLRTVDIINYAPTIDAEPVVRCRDCKCRAICRTSNVWAVPPQDSWFCADGKREDAVQVRRGHWVELRFDEEDRLLGELYKCSICSGIVPRKTFQSGRYCPNCGAKMDEVSE